MQKVIDVLIKTKDENGHVRHLGLDDVEVDSIIIKQNVIDAAAQKKISEKSAEAKKKAAAEKKPEKKAEPKKETKPKTTKSKTKK